jgi:hypothetical protein
MLRMPRLSISVLHPDGVVRNGCWSASLEERSDDMGFFGAVKMIEGEIAIPRCARFAMT